MKSPKDKNQKVNLMPILLKKEMTQFRRNAFLPRLLLILPIMLMLIMPWVTNMDVRNIHITDIDSDRSSLSQRIISHIAASDYFKLNRDYADYQSAIVALDNDKVDVIVSIPAHFERDMQNGTQEPISIVANAVNATKGGQGMQYTIQTIATTLSEIQSEQGLETQSSLIVTENRYNPTGNYRHFMIPALMIILLLLVCCFLPAMNIVAEKESGTIEQLNVTPITTMQFTLSKLIPYWLMGLLELVVAMLLANWIYGLSPAGSVGTIFLGAILFIVCMSALGVAVANISNTLQQTIYVMFFFVMIFMLMSGLMTPIASMPQWAQYMSYAFPPRYLIEIMRAVYLKGTTTAELGFNLLILTVLALLFSLIAVKSYRKQA